MFSMFSILGPTTKIKCRTKIYNNAAEVMVDFDPSFKSESEANAWIFMMYDVFENMNLEVEC